MPGNNPNQNLKAGHNKPLEDRKFPGMTGYGNLGHGHSKSEEPPVEPDQDPMKSGRTTEEVARIRAENAETEDIDFDEADPEERFWERDEEDFDVDRDMKDYGDDADDAQDASAEDMAMRERNNMSDLLEDHPEHVEELEEEEEEDQ